DEVAQGAEAAGLGALAKFLRGNSLHARFLGALFDLSDFARHYARREPQALGHLLKESLQARFETLLAAIARSPYEEDVSESSLMRQLRRLKTEAHFLIALADLSGEADAPATV